MPTVRELTDLVAQVKAQITKECRAFEDDTVPGIQLTIGYNPETKAWDYQTGDNSYTGAAYGYPVWSVMGVYRSTNCRNLAKEMRDELHDWR